ncbi:hypothetical protein THAOC_16663, partial [Thalassiosira oceanica]
MSETKVAVVVATNGEDRLCLLLDRCLKSVANQTRLADLVVVVSDNEPSVSGDDDFLHAAVKNCFARDEQSKVRLIHNTRTRHMSGTGAWNSGILYSLGELGENCFVAILDDDDEWLETHIEENLKAAAAQENCQWVVSGILRLSPSSPAGGSPENILKSEPSANLFYATNPGIQGSNLFVRMRALLSAGLFDEALPSTTDRDLCIRLCDVLSGTRCNWFASTGVHTVRHYADTGRERVSRKGSPSKRIGLQRFFYKYCSRMNADERRAFIKRAIDTFGCTENDFDVSRTDGNKHRDPRSFTTLSADVLPLNRSTTLPRLHGSDDVITRRVIFGVITSNIDRVGGVLDDLSHIPGSFVMIFANGDDSLADAIKVGLRLRGISGSYVLNKQSQA